MLNLLLHMDAESQLEIYKLLIEQQGASYTTFIEWMIGIFTFFIAVGIFYNLYLSNKKIENSVNEEVENQVNRIEDNLVSSLNEDYNALRTRLVNELKEHKAKLTEKNINQNYETELLSYYAHLNYESLNYLIYLIMAIKDLNWLVNKELKDVSELRALLMEYKKNVIEKDFTSMLNIELNDDFLIKLRRHLNEFTSSINFPAVVFDLRDEAIEYNNRVKDNITNILDQKK